MRIARIFIGCVGLSPLATAAFVASRNGWMVAETFMFMAMVIAALFVRDDT